MGTFDSTFFLENESFEIETSSWFVFFSEDKMKLIAMVFTLVSVFVLFGCGNKNRYLNNYSGERYKTTRNCMLINAELKFYASGETFEQQLNRYKEMGYRVIGIGNNDAVVNCTKRGTDYQPFEGTNWSKERSQCTVTQLDNNNQKRVQQACRLVGANIALFDSQRILYLRNQ